MDQHCVRNHVGLIGVIAYLNIQLSIVENPSLTIQFRPICAGCYQAIRWLLLVHVDDCLHFIRITDRMANVGWPALIVCPRCGNDITTPRKTFEAILRYGGGIVILVGIVQITVIASPRPVDPVR